MAYPADQQDIEVGLFIDGEWVDAAEVGNGVRWQPTTIRRGRANWSSRVETSSAGWTMDNRDGRWSPDYASGAYAGLYKRNIPCRVGVARDDVHVTWTGGAAEDVVSTPDVAGTGGGSPTTPTVQSVTESSTTTLGTTHTVDMPATITAGDRLLLIINLGHESGAASSDLDDWTQVVSASMFVWSRVLVYELECDSAAATALAGGSVDFTTTVNQTSSAQVYRVSGVRSGGSGSAWAVSAGTAYAFTTTPNPDSLTVPWGADANLFIAFFAANGDGEAVTGNPSGYTAGADGDTAAGYTVGSAYKASSLATDDPGTFTIADTENVLAWTFAYRPVEDTSSDGVLDISGDIDVRIEYQMFEFPVDTAGSTRYSLVAKGASSGGGWRLRLFKVNGYLGVGFVWRDSSNVLHNYEAYQFGTNIPPTELFSDRVAIRFTLDVNDGAADSVGTFYWSDAIDGTWTQFGTDSGDGVVDLKTNDAPIELAASVTDSTTYLPFPGVIYAFELRDGIAGTVVANPDFTAQTVGASSFVDSAGRTWTVGAGGELSAMRWRFHGELSSIPVRWDVQGKDVTAPVEAAGLFRRLRQGARPVTSPFRRAIISSTANFIQYWPLEETGVQVRRFGAAIGSAPHTVEGGFPTTGASETFISMASVVDPNLTSFIANVDSYTGTGQAQIRWLMSIPSRVAR